MRKSGWLSGSGGALTGLLAGAGLEVLGYTNPALGVGLLIAAAVMGALTVWYARRSGDLRSLAREWRLTRARLLGRWRPRRALLRLYREGEALAERMPAGNPRRPFKPQEAAEARDWHERTCATLKVAGLPNTLKSVSKQGVPENPERLRIETAFLKHALIRDLGYEWPEAGA